MRFFMMVAAALTALAITGAVWELIKENKKGKDEV